MPRDVIAAASAMGGDLLRAFIGEVLARKSSLDPHCVELFSKPATELADRMDYRPFEKAALDWFAFLSIGDRTLGDSKETFSDYEEERDVWVGLCEAVS